MAGNGTKNLGSLTAVGTMFEDTSVDRDPNTMAAMVEMEEVAKRGIRTPKALTPLQEAYCQHRADGMGKKDAYLKSGLMGDKKPGNETKYATDLENRIYIATRIGVLKAAKILRLEQHGEIEQPPETDDGELAVTQDWVRRQLVDMATEARVAGNMKDAINCVKLLGQSIGMFADGKPTGKEKTKPNEGQTDSNVIPQNPITLQIVNQFLDDANDDAGDGAAARDITPARGADKAHVQLDGRDRSNAASSILDGLAGAFAEGVPVKATG